MKYAINENNVNQKYYCINCNRAVKLVIAKNKNNYFRHIKTKKIKINQTQRHIDAKRKIAKDFESIGYVCKFEYAINGNSQRIDVFVSGYKRKYAVEFQNSEISDEKLAERITGYFEYDFKNIWILSMNYYSKNITPRQLKFINYSTKWNYYLLFLDVRTKRYILFHHIKQVGINLKITYTVKVFSDFFELLSTKKLYINKMRTNTQTPDEVLKRKCYSYQIDLSETWEKLENIIIEFPPIFCEDFISAMIDFENSNSIKNIIKIPPMIKINTHLTNELLSGCYRIFEKYCNLFLIKF